MDSIQNIKKHLKPEVGRGCSFCNDGEESQAIPNDGCFKLHETPWLEDYPDNIPTDIFEVRFKNTRRSYYQNTHNIPLKRGDVVAVESSPGHDIGIISLTGDLVARQMKRTGFTPFNNEYKKIYRKAKPFDIERWQEAIALEHETMILSRQIASDMGLNMKIGDVEYQGDMIKAIFYYIADERVDFRELIKVFAERFHIRIEMKQIGARQEAGRIGGIGACGRQLCCTSWMSNFSSVTTNAARVQEISLNPQKLAGQCSKLKCCMMYEYDTYVDARKSMPRIKDPLQAMDGDYHLFKTDILAGTMSFTSSRESLANIITIPIARVREILSVNRAGKKVDTIVVESAVAKVVVEPTYRSEEDSITRFDGAKRKTGNNNNNRRRRNGNESPRANDAGDRVKPTSVEGKEEPKANVAAEGRNSRNNTRRRQPRQPQTDVKPEQGAVKVDAKPKSEVTPSSKQNGAPVVKQNDAPKGDAKPRNFKNRSNRPNADQKQKTVDNKASEGKKEVVAAVDGSNTQPRSPRPANRQNRNRRPNPNGPKGGNGGGEVAKAPSKE